MTSKQSLKKLKSKEKPIEWFYLIPLAFIMAVVPLIVRLKVATLDPEVAYFWTGNVNYDFFSYYKMVFLVIATMAAGFVFIYLLSQRRITIRKTQIYIPIGVYTACVILSTIFSKHKQVSIIGFPDRYEGMLAQLCYMAILFLTINMVRDERHIKFLLGSLMASAGLVGLISVSQFLDTDPFGTELGKSLLIPDAYAELRDSVNFTFDGSSRVYGTFFNPNYVGSYAAMLIPLTLTLLFAVKKIIFKLPVAMVLLVMVVSLLGSQSRAGIFGVAGALLVMLLLFRKVLWKHKIISVLAVVLIAGTFLSVNQMTEGLIWRRVASAIENFSPTPETRVEDIILEGNSVSIVMTDATIKAVIETLGQSYFVNETGDILEATIEDSVVKFSQEPYNRYVFEFNYQGNPNLFRMRNYDMKFYITDQGLRFVNEKGVPVLIEEVERFGFEGKEKFASNRGYIWSRSIPLLKQTAIVGFGADIYAMHFPQHDYVGKYKAMGNINTLVDKPHNLYLQMGINTGVLSALAYLVILCWSVLKMFKQFCFSKFENYSEIVGSGILVAVLAYMAASILNDSVVSVAPVFWSLLGIAIAINHMSLEKA